jgi:hypothetical protein
MEFALVGALIVLLGLAGAGANRRSYALVGGAAVVASIAILAR